MSSLGNGLAPLPIRTPLIDSHNMMVQPWVKALQSLASGSILFGTHAQRLTSTPSSGNLYFETDRNYIGYLGDGSNWNYTGGVAFGTISGLYGGLTAADAGLLYLTSDTSQLFRWSGTAWAPEAIGMVVTPTGKIGYGLNLSWNGTNWVSGTIPNNGCGAILVDAVTGIVSIYAVPETGTTVQTISPATLEANFKVFSMDPRTSTGSGAQYAYTPVFLPLVDTQWLLLENGTPAAARRARFDLSGMTAGSSFIYGLPDHTASGGANVILAGEDPPHGGTGQVALPGAAGAHNWKSNSVLVGSGPDATTFLIGVNGSVTLAKLSGGGTNGSMTVTSGIITSLIAPT